MRSIYPAEFWRFMCLESWNPTHTHLSCHFWGKGKRTPTCSVLFGSLWRRITSWTRMWSHGFEFNHHFGWLNPLNPYVCWWFVLPGRVAPCCVPSRSISNRPNDSWSPGKIWWNSTWASQIWAHLGMLTLTDPHTHTHVYIYICTSISIYLSSYLAI